MNSRWSWQLRVGVVIYLLLIAILLFMWIDQTWPSIRAGWEITL